MPKLARSKTQDSEETTHQPAYFLSLTLKNIRCFDSTEQTLNLADGKGGHARWTVILGDNGTGKTTLLRLLASMQPYRDPEQPDKWRLGYARTYDISPRNPDLSTFVGAKCDIGLIDAQSRSKPVHLYRKGSRKSKSYYWTQSRPRAGDEFWTMFAYGANRLMGTGPLHEIPSSPLDDPSVLDEGVRSLFQDAASLINGEEWLRQAHYLSLIGEDTASRRGAKKRFERIRKLLIDLLPQDDIDDLALEPVGDGTVTSSVEVRAKTPYGWVNFRDLSLGYRTLLAWIIDLAARLFARYPHSENPLHEPAVVLIDEIDLHLHPRWQRQLFGELSEKFPHVQFIVTAHSPLIVQGADANIVVLRRPEGADHVIIDPAHEAVRTWRVDQILTSDLYGLPSARSPELDEKYARRRELLREPNLNRKEKAELDALEAWLVDQPGGENPEEMSFWRTLRDVTTSLQAKRKRAS